MRASRANVRDIRVLPDFSCGREVLAGAGSGIVLRQIKVQRNKSSFSHRLTYELLTRVSANVRRLPNQSKGLATLLARLAGNITAYRNSRNITAYRNHQNSSIS